jgi:uncharacterized protein (DUF1697 family)
LKTYVALLHSIILHAGRRVVMADLRKISENAGFQNPRTLGATGNLVLDCPEALPLSEVERRLERGIEEGFGKHIDVIARTGGGWLRLAEGNPFPRESALDASLVAVRVMRAPLPESALEALEPWRMVGEKIKIVKGDLWVSFAGKPSQSRLLSRLTARHLGAGTLRNWNTVRGLARLIEG